MERWACKRVMEISRGPKMNNMTQNSNWGELMLWLAPRCWSSCKGAPRTRDEALGTGGPSPEERLLHKAVVPATSSVKGWPFKKTTYWHTNTTRKLVCLIWTEVEAVHVSPREEHFENGIRTPKPCSSTGARRSFVKMVNINFFRTLETHQRSPRICSIKWLNLGKTRGLCGIFTCPIPSPSPKLHNSLKTYSVSVTRAVKTNSLTSTGE